MRTRRTGWVVLLGILAVALLFGPALLGFWVDWLWFGELGQQGVFWTLFRTRWLLGLGFGVALAGFTYLNVALAQRFSPALRPRAGAQEWQVAAGRMAREGLNLLLIGGSLALGFLGGTVAATQWESWIRFVNPQRLGVADPVLNTDVGFYLFRYPFLEFLDGWLFMTLILVLLATAAVYAAHGAIGTFQGRLYVDNPVRAHLSVLLGLTMLSKAWDFWLDRYGLLLNPSGLFYGATYTDVHARLPALNILMVVAVVAAVGFFLNARLRVLWLPGLAVTLMVVAGLTVGGLYPSLVQQLYVVPNQQGRERPFIRHHLELTRRAYGLNAIRNQEYALGDSLTAQDLEREEGTVKNIRLWDYRVVGRAFQQIQQIRDYYDVSDVDIDRYVVDGQYRQVMLAPRELMRDRLRQRQWVNETLQYTHGYGLVMAAVNEADETGWPVWMVRNLPLDTTPGVEVTRPEIYYGLRPSPPVIAPSGVPEFDYPQETDFHTTRYEGKGGIPLTGVNRPFFSAYMGDWNLTISDQIQPNSRLLIRRNVQERIAAMAPFLLLDHDPYLVVLDGRQVWVQDAYTHANTFPYSSPSELPAGQEASEFSRDRFNYLRNSVKAVVDAYDGTVTLYAMDDSDAMLRCYRQAFPGLFTPADQMPDGLRAHLRYPEGIFSLQATKLNRYHVTNPDVFYAQSDVWEFPTERLQEGETTSVTRMEPYYVLMRLPGEQQEEFAMILPYKTNGGTSLIAWLVARCDPANYGELLLYHFPTNRQVDLPEQVDNAISADVRISSQITLLSRQGSRVQYGNLLVLPVAQSLLYVKPLYVEGAGPGGRGIPQLKYVILAEKRGTRIEVVMEPTLEAALAQLVGGPAPPRTTTRRPPAPTQGAAPPPVGTPTAPPNVTALANEAEAAFEAADRALRQGDWAEFGRQMERARAAVSRLRETTGGAQ
ncbi:MAG: UPF0182 family protein [Armatimonadota bacterium]